MGSGVVAQEQVPCIVVLEVLCTHTRTLDRTLDVPPQTLDLMLVDPGIGKVIKILTMVYHRISKIQKHVVCTPTVAINNTTFPDVPLDEWY